MRIKIITSIVLAVLFTVGANAQKKESYSYVEIQGGGQFTSTDADITKLLTPTIGLSVGHYSVPYLGYRLSLNGFESKGRFEELDQNYKWKYFTTSADLLVNISQIFSSNNHFADVIFLSGIGLNYAWNNDELNSLVEKRIVRAPMMWKDSRFMHTIHAGLRLESNTNKRLGFSLELSANSTSDRFNSKTNNNCDWYFVGMLGINYRFNRHLKETPQPLVETPQPVIVDETPEPVKRFVKKTVCEDIEENMHVEIFYAIRGCEPTEKGRVDLQSIADFMKNHKNVVVTINGYADAATGNPKINLGYSQRRADLARDIIIGYGGDSASIVTKALGDTEQPFDENDKNRCVIIDAKGIKTIEKTIEVEE